MVLAITREDLDQKKQEAEKKEHKDKRNLFLAREGCKILSVDIKAFYSRISYNYL